MERAEKRKNLPLRLDGSDAGDPVFHMHWQISFYSCLASVPTGSGMCGRFREQGGSMAAVQEGYSAGGGVGGALFQHIAMSFAPLYSWSQQSERGGTVSGAAGRVP